jgi:hypothetical protein
VGEEGIPGGAFRGEGEGVEDEMGRDPVDTTTLAQE